MSTAVASLPQIRPATLEDHAQIVRIERANSLESMSEENWRNLWLANPVWDRVAHDWPIGWILESGEGEPVGSLINIPSRYMYRGEELICSNGRGWVVDHDYRAYALALMGEYFSQENVDLYMNTTVGPNAAPMISTLSERIPCGDFQRVAYFATEYHPLATKALRRKHVPLASMWAYPAAAALRLKDAYRCRELHATQSNLMIEHCDRFDARFDPFWNELFSLNPHKLLSARDRDALAWHFAGPLRRGHLWIITAMRDGLLRGYAIFKRQDLDGPLRRMRLIDFHSVESGEEILSVLLSAALKRCRQERIQVLEHLGCGLPKLATFDRFAPYRRELPCWPFYYLANRPDLEQALSQPTVWDPSTYDGDASYD